MFLTGISKYIRLYIIIFFYGIFTNSLLFTNNKIYLQAIFVYIYLFSFFFCTYKRVYIAHTRTGENKIKCIYKSNKIG